MKDSTLIEYLNARIKTLEKENKKLKEVFKATHKTKYELIKELEKCEQQVANLKREKVAMQTR